MTIEFKPGDWVRFIRDNVFVIGEVRYQRKTVTGRMILLTDAGEVDVAGVVEVRHEFQEARTP